MIIRRSVRNTYVTCVLLYWINHYLSSILPLLLIPSWPLTIDPLLVACATESVMLLTRGSKPLDGCFHPQGASGRSLRLRLPKAYAFTTTTHTFLNSLGQVAVRERRRYPIALRAPFPSHTRSRWSYNLDFGTHPTQIFPRSFLFT